MYTPTTATQNTAVDWVYIGLDLCADLKVSAAARRSFLVGGGGAPTSKNRRRRRQRNIGGGGVRRRGQPENRILALKFLLQVACSIMKIRMFSKNFFPTAYNLHVLL